jgi:hypothetical protein
MRECTMCTKLGIMHEGDDHKKPITYIFCKDSHNKVECEGDLEKCLKELNKNCSLV